MDVSLEIHFHLDNCSSPCINAGVDVIEINGISYYAPIDDFEGDDRPYLNTLPDIGADETPCFATSINDSKVELSTNNLIAYPNPFNSNTTIEFALPNPEFVSLNIYNIQGQKVEDILSETLSPGNHKLNWDASDFSSGVYYYKIEAGSFSQTKKLLLIK